MNSKFIKHSKSNSKVEDTIENILPKESMLQIFSYLDVISLSRCAQVSKAWNSIALDGTNWQNIDLFNFQRDVEADLIENISYRCGGFLRQLSLRGCKSIENISIQTLAQSCQSLEVLNLSGCTKVSDDACRYLSSYCSRLTSLNLESCSSITNDSLETVSQGCLFLESINISWCDRITDSGVINFAKKCHKLRVFIAKGCKNMTPDAVLALANNCPDLEVCNFLSCHEVNDHAVSKLAEKCKNLRYICLSGCTEISDTVLMALADYCLNLNTLEVAGCVSLTDSGFLNLTAKCVKLERMDLEECHLITNRTLQQLAANCPNLEKLSLSHCSGITDEGIKMLSNGRCAAEQLMVLELDNCPLITDDCVEYLIKFHNLRRIELYDCQKISRKGIETLKVCTFSYGVSILNRYIEKVVIFSVHKIKTPLVHNSNFRCNDVKCYPFHPIPALSRIIDFFQFRKVCLALKHIHGT